MKIKITEIEATTEDLRVSNSAADGLLSLLRNVFQPRGHSYDEEGEDESEKEGEQDE